MRPLRLVPAAVLAVVLAGLAAPGASALPRATAARRPAASSRAATARYRPTGRLQVRFKPGVSVAAQTATLARVTAQGVRVHVDRRIPTLNAALLSVSDARAVQALLREQSTVAYVEPESRYKAFVNDASTPEAVEIGSWATRTSGSPNTGTGTEIAVIDSQVDSANTDLDGASKVTFAGDFSTLVPPNPEDPNDPQNFACVPATCPHGTAVAVAAAGEDGDGNLAGVAPDAKIRSYNVFRRFVYPPDSVESVGASSADIAAALGDVATYASTHPALVAVNMSLGGTFDNKLVRDAIKNVHDTAPRVTVVVAAGNDGGERANFPAGDPYALSVGATGQVTGDDCSVSVSPSDPWTVAFFSNRGDVDVVAPGHCLSLWYPPEDPDTGAVTGPAVIQKVSGTSFAAPMVAGEVALLASSSTPLAGDAARAAVIAGADHTGSSVDIGQGAAKIAGALALGAGSTAFTALSVTRGGQVATAVGTRPVEAIHVDPTGGSTPSAPALTATTGFGSYSGSTSFLATGLSRVEATFTVPNVNKIGQPFSLTATGGGGGADTNVVPMKMLDASDGYEGVPAASNESTSVPLTWGSRSSYIRSANVASLSQLGWTWTFDPHGYANNANIFIWEPATGGGVADAGFEPLAYEIDSTNSDFVVPGSDTCDTHTCRSGRWLIGWLLGGPADDSDGTSYKLKLSYDGPTATLSTPALASSVSTTGPFTVSWSGTHAAKFDVYYATKTKVGSSWVITSWKPWFANTTAHSAVFGASNSPVKVTAGQTYHFLVRSWDSLGNPSLTTSKHTSTPVDDRYVYMQYSSGWAGYDNIGHWLGTLHQSLTAGAKAALNSETSQFTVVGDKCAACGQFRVYIDGVYKVTVDTHSASTLKKQVLWTSATFSGGAKAHRIALVAVGTAGRPKIVLDGIGTVR